jgi:hypothetical protein
VSLLICLLSAVVLGPLCTLAHELGHALVALRCADGPVRIRIGGARWATRLRLGRLRISFSPCGLGGRCSYRAPQQSRRQHIRGALAGPSVNLVVALALVPGLIGSSGVGHIALLTAVAINVAMAAGNVLPMRGRSSVAGDRAASDGLQVWSLLRR